MLKYVNKPLRYSQKHNLSKLISSLNNPNTTNQPQKTMSSFSPSNKSRNTNSHKSNKTSSYINNTSPSFQQFHIINELSNKKKAKETLQLNINELNHKIELGKSTLEKYKQCNIKNGEENLEMEFKQDDILHERIHLSGVVPRIRVHINDIRDEISKIEKETKMYEILKIQMMQEKMFMESDFEEINKKVKEMTIENSNIKHEVNVMKRKIKEIKIVISQKSKKNNFIQDITNLIMKG